jgi:hypothetical protein
MNIVIRRVVKETVSVAWLVVFVPAREVECDDCYTGPGRVPKDFLGKTDGYYRFRVNVATKKIDDWPAGLEVDAHFKPRDGGIYELVLDDGYVIARSGDCYVPGWLSHNDGGDDYLDFKVGPNGVWRGLSPRSDRVQEWASLAQPK